MQALRVDGRLRRAVPDARGHVPGRLGGLHHCWVDLLAGSRVHVRRPECILHRDFQRRHIGRVLSDARGRQLRHGVILPHDHAGGDRWDVGDDGVVIRHLSVHHRAARRRCWAGCCCRALRHAPRHALQRVLVRRAAPLVDLTNNRARGPFLWRGLRRQRAAVGRRLGDDARGEHGGGGPLAARALRGHCRFFFPLDVGVLAARQDVSRHGPRARGGADSRDADRDPHRDVLVRRGTDHLRLSAARPARCDGGGAGDRPRQLRRHPDHPPRGHRLRIRKVAVVLLSVVPGPPGGGVHAGHLSLLRQGLAPGHPRRCCRVCGAGGDRRDARDRAPVWGGCAHRPRLAFRDLRRLCARARGQHGLRGKRVDVRFLPDVQDTVRRRARRGGGQRIAIRGHRQRGRAAISVRVLWAVPVERQPHQRPLRRRGDTDGNGRRLRARGPASRGR
mmetsp:Transcript_37264/g.88148  ORF Transcript_37264/g.88148 Transcript_37264/m.88148 type:complete len:447 (+) Transcript_37264:6185-7525(+)